MVVYEDDSNRFFSSSKSFLQIIAISFRSFLHLDSALTLSFM